MKKLIQNKAKTDEMLHAGMEDGMTTLVQDGIQKVLQGHTTYKEVESRRHQVGMRRYARGTGYRAGCRAVRRVNSRSNRAMSPARSSFFAQATA